MAHQLQRQTQGHPLSAEVQIQILKEELDTANKKLDRYAHLVVSLSEELDSLRRNICHGCKKKFVPSYSESPPFASSSNGPQPSLWRRIVRVGGRQTASPSLALPSISPLKSETPLDTSNPVNPIITPPDQVKMANSVSNQVSSATTPRQPSIAPVDDEQPKKLEWNVSHNPQVEQTLHVDHVKTLEFATKVFCVKFSPDGKYLAVGFHQDSRRIDIYDVVKGLNTHFCVDFESKGLHQPMWCIQFSSDNKYIAFSSDIIRLWEIRPKRIRAVFSGNNIAVYTICFSPNGRFLVSGGDGGIRIWSLRDGSSKKLISVVSGFLFVTFSPDGRHIAAVDNDQYIFRIWNVHTGRLVNEWKGPRMGAALCMAFSPDGNGLVSGGEDGVLTYWDVGSLAVMGASRRGVLEQGLPGTRTFEGHTGTVRSVSFSPKYRWVVTSSQDQSVRIWDPHTATWQCTLHGHEGYVRTVDFSPTGKYLASGSEDGVVGLWKYRETV